MGRVERRTTRALLLACAAAGGCVMVGMRAFTEPPANSQQLSRSAALRILPAVAIGAAGSAPTFAAGELQTGTTKAWGTFSSGEPDTFHTGGVEWEDIKVGKGATPQKGDLIAIDLVVKAYIREKEIIVDDSKDTPRDYRWGVGQLPAGIDEGIEGMRTGGVRLMRIPGNLAFGNKAIPAAVGRPGVPANTPLEATITLKFIPGLDDVYEAETDITDGLQPISAVEAARARAKEAQRKK